MEQGSLFEAAEAPEVVYFVTNLDAIKIGWTTRSATIRAREVGASSVLLTIPGGLLEERRHHKRWAQYRIGRTEWFRPGPRLVLWLVAEMAKRGMVREVVILEEALRRSELDAA